jgi:glycogen phosphorylase
MFGSTGNSTGNIPVAYFSMEIGLVSAMPTYSGGLGVLAGDTLRAAADMGVPMIGITLIHRKGYFRQYLDAAGNQTEEPVIWDPARYLEPIDTGVTVTIEGRPVKIRAWRYRLKGDAVPVPVYFLDTALPENSAFDQTLTDCLYGGDNYYRLCQEVILGVGGIATLRALGFTHLRAYHMNEGHSALLILALLKEQMTQRQVCEVSQPCIQDVRDLCVFTTHTPVPAAIDQFPSEMVHRVLGEADTLILRSAACFRQEVLNMTYLGLCFSRYINGVSQRHEQISHGMFPNYPIDSITNGVHAPTWTTSAFADLYDARVPEWRRDNLYLRYTISIPLEEIQRAHAVAKQALLKEVEERSGVQLDHSVLTIGYARRSTGYKRPNLIFADINRLKQIAQVKGPLQIIYAGKAHPRDEGGKDLIRSIFKAAAELKNVIRVVYLEDYNIDLARFLCAGVDLWLNTPKIPEEASGTSGMKAALNGVPSLSILDGWWIEGHVEGVTGWSIGENWAISNLPEAEIASLYNKLEFVILPLFYSRPRDFAWVMRNAIALNGSFYHSQRMLYQYLKNAYYPDNNHGNGQAGGLTSGNHAAGRDLTGPG